MFAPGGFHYHGRRMWRVRDLCIAVLLVFLWTGCQNDPPSQPPDNPDAPVPPGEPPDGMQPPNPMCAVGQICACSGDSDCASGFCECADASCTQRMCSATPCSCSFGATCDQPLNEGTADPNLCPENGACYGGTCLVAAPVPEPPAQDDSIENVTVTVRTRTAPESGTGNTVTLCLSASDCYTLDRLQVSDLQPGKIDAFQFEFPTGLPRSRIDRVQLSMAGEAPLNDWEPACVSLQLDGQPSYCLEETPTTAFPIILGDNSNATLLWRDDAWQERNACTSCYPELLTHGPIIGAVEPDRALIWVRTDLSRRVGLRLSGGAALASAPVVAWAYSTPANDFTSVLETKQLQPGTTYYYGVEIDGMLYSDPSWTFTTPPPRGQQGTFTFGVGSCARREHPQDIFRPIAEAKPDLFLFVGDNHYGDATNLGAQRWNYQYMAESVRRLLFATVPTLAIWDDHDFLGNDTNGNDTRRTMARRAFLEYWANPSYGEDGQGIYFQHSYGDVDFFMLDGRFSRDPTDGTVTFGDPQGRPSLLGATQTTWFIEQLRASTATFKFVVVGSQWTRHGNPDSWASFIDARDALFDAIAEHRIEGVVLLSGDRHRSEYRLLPRPSAYDLPEITSSPLANEVRECDLEDDDLIFCEGLNPDTDEQYYQVSFLTVDTTLADPKVSATLYRHNGVLEPVYTWEILHSQLDFE